MAKTFDQLQIQAMTEQIEHMRATRGIEVQILKLRLETLVVENENAKIVRRHLKKVEKASDLPPIQTDPKQN